MLTWYDVKLATLQKMFAADASIITDESTTGYIAAMPYAANEALQMLSTAGKFIVKSFTIVHNPIKNLIGDSISKEVHQIVKGEQSFSVGGAHSYYFEVSGIGSYSIYFGEELQETIPIDSMSVFTPFKGIFANNDNLEVTLKFESAYPMAIRNVAMYEAIYPEVEDVPIFRDKIPYVLTDFAEDFYQLDLQGVFYTGAYSEYIQTSDFYQEGDKTLVLPYDKRGSYTVYYKAYPSQITKETEDEYELPLDPEVLALLPLYMASQLYKDDDNGIATTYRNEFEVAFERLKNSANRSSKKEFTSISGWI